MPQQGGALQRLRCRTRSEIGSSAQMNRRRMRFKVASFVSIVGMSCVRQIAATAAVRWRGLGVVCGYHDHRYTIWQMIAFASLSPIGPNRVSMGYRQGLTEHHRQPACVVVSALSPAPHLFAARGGTPALEPTSDRPHRHRLFKVFIGSISIRSSVHSFFYPERQAPFPAFVSVALLLVALPTFPASHGADVDRSGERTAGPGPPGRTPLFQMQRRELPMDGIMTYRCFRQTRKDWRGGVRGGTLEVSRVPWLIGVRRIWLLQRGPADPLEEAGDFTSTNHGERNPYRTVRADLACRSQRCERSGH